MRSVWQAGADTELVIDLREALASTYAVVDTPRGMVLWERKPFYQNLVTLELVQDSVVVTIDQPLGLSVQLFDAGNGKLWWSREENWK